jgi:hypothetical protein
MFTAPRFFSQNATFLMDFSRAGDAEPQPKVSWPQKSAKDHKENKLSKFFSLYSLHCNPSESRMFARIFFRAENSESAEQQRERRSAKDSFSAPCASVRTCPFRHGFGCGAPCQAVEYDLWNKML